MKRYALCLMLALCFVTGVHGADYLKFTGSAGFSYIRYGDDAFSQTRKAAGGGFFPIAVELEGGIRVGFIPNLNFMVSIVSSLESFSGNNGGNYSLDYGFSGGISVYYGTEGLSFGLEYITGRRSDFYAGSESASTPWGNGFRFKVEYELTDLFGRFIPGVGMSWRYMPRGNDAYDSFTSVYVRAAY